MSVCCPGLSSPSRFVFFDGCPLGDPLEKEEDVGRLRKRRKWEVEGRLGTRPGQARELKIKSLMGWRFLHRRWMTIKTEGS